MKKVGFRWGGGKIQKGGGDLEVGGFRWKRGYSKGGGLRYGRDSGGQGEGITVGRGIQEQEYPVIILNSLIFFFLVTLLINKLKILFKKIIIFLIMLKYLITDLLMVEELQQL